MPRRRVVVIEKVCMARGIPRRRGMLYSIPQGTLEVQLGQSGGQTLQLMRSHFDLRLSSSLALSCVYSSAGYPFAIRHKRINKIDSMLLFMPSFYIN